MASHKFHFSLNRQPFLMKGMEVHLALIDHDLDGNRKVFLAQPVEFKQLTADEQCCETIPMATISDEAGQQLMDELWRCGLRPTEGTGSAGSLAATQKHLEDMRSLVFKTPKL